MEKFSISRVVSHAVLLVVLTAAPSCVSNKYELSQENLDLKMTLFQEGVSLPLGSVEAISLGSIISMAGLEEEFEKYFKVGSDGGYTMSVSGKMDLSEDLSSLTEMVNIDKIEVNSDIAFNLQDVDVSGVKIDRMEYTYSKKLSELVTLPDVKFPDFDPQIVSISAGLSDYAIDMVSFNNMLAANLPTAFSETDALVTLPSEAIDMLPDSDQRIPIDVRNPAIPGMSFADTYTLDEKIRIPLYMEFPSYITEIKEIKFSDNTELYLKLMLTDSFFSEGTIDPTLDVNLHDLFHLTAEENSGHMDYIDDIHEHLELTHENGWSADKAVRITSLVLKDGDIKYDEGKGCLVLDKVVEISPSCQMHYEGLATTNNMIKEHRQVIMKLDIEFRNFALDDAVFSAEVDTDDMAVTETFPIKGEPFEIPEQIESIGTVRFTEDSNITLSITMDNPVTNLGVELSTLEVEFPDAIKIGQGEGYALEGNKIVIPAQDISSKPWEKKINILGFELPKPENGEITIDEQVNVNANVKVTAQNVSLKEILASSDNGLSIKAEVRPVLDFDDCDFEIAKAGFELDLLLKEIRQEIPEALKDVDVVTITPEGEPEISIDVQMPDLKAVLGQDSTIDIVPSENGLMVSFPQVLRFPQSWPDDKYYNHQNHALKYTDEFADVVFPIEKIEIRPEVGADGKLYVSGELRVVGGFSMTGGRVTYKELEKLVNDPNSVVAFSAVMDELLPKSVGMGEGKEYEYPAGRFEYALDFVDGLDLPEMIDEVSVIELDDVKLFLDIDASSLPSLGEGATLTLEVDASLPDFVMLDQQDPRVNGSTMHIEVVGKDNTNGAGLLFEMEPIKIVGMDMCGVDFGSESQVEHKIVLDANVVMRGVELDTDKWLGSKHEISLKAAIKSDKDYAAGEPEVIGINSVKAKVDYAIEPVREKIDLSDIAEILNGENIDATINLNRFYIAIDLETNLGISAKADLKVVPEYNGVPDESRALESKGEILIDGAQSADELVTTGFWISNTDKGMPAGYKFIDFDLLSLLKNMPESIVVELTAGTDKDKDVLFEPGAAYVLRAEFAAGLPLEFGQQQQMTVREVITDIPSELATLMKYGSLGIGAVIENSLPFAVGLTMNLLDSERNIIPMKAGGGKFKINSCNANGKPVKSKIDLLFAKEKNTDVSDISAIEIILTVDTKDAVGVPLKKDSFIRVERLFARIPEGVTLDLNVLNVEDDNE